MSKGVKLTPKQEAFVTSYIKYLNATKAAIEAGYSEKNADKIGSQLLGKIRVKEAIQAQMDKRAERTKIDADFVLTGLAKIAKSGEVEANKIKAFELIGKHLGMYRDKVDIEHSGGINVIIGIPDKEE